MTFREFAVNYISPVYVLFRLTFLYMTGFGLFTTLSVNAEHMNLAAFLVALALTYVVVVHLPRWAVFTLMFTGLNPLISTSIDPGFLNLALGATAVLVWQWNALRPWQVGMNFQQINQRMDEWQRR